MYAAGLGVPENVYRATELYKKAYKRGNEFGLINLAYKLEDGVDPEKDYRDAAKLFEEGIDRGIAWARTQYAYLLETGKLPVEEGEGFQSADPAKAEMLYLKSASEGDPGSMWHLGQLYESGRLGETNLDGAKHWYGKLEQKDESYYLGLLGEHYLSVGFIPKRVKKAIEVLEKAERAGSAFASFKLGQLFLSSSTIGYSGEDAAEKFRRAIKRGSVEAQFSLGELLLNPEIPPNDTIQGKQLIVLAAKQKTPWIMYSTANILLDGGDEGDFEEALGFHKNAAEKGYGWSRRELIRVYGSNMFDEVQSNLAREQLDFLIENQDSTVLRSMLDINYSDWKDNIPSSFSAIDKHSCSSGRWFHCFDFDQSELLRKLREIAVLDIPNARAQLLLYYTHVDRCEDAKREFGLLKSESDRNNDEAQIALVEVSLALNVFATRDGCKVGINEDEIERYLLGAAASGNDDAISYVIMFLPWHDLEKDGMIHPDMLALLEEKGGQSGETKFWEMLGSIFEYAEQPWKSAIWYRMALEGGEPSVAERLAGLYFYDFSPRRVGDAIAVAKNHMEPDAARAFLLDLRNENTLISSHDDVLKAAIGDLDTGIAQ